MKSENKCEHGAVLSRSGTGFEGTAGKFKTTFGFECCTMELPFRDNRQDVSCIPKGIYIAERVQSPRYGECFQVKDVPGRSHILFHNGNWAGDETMGFRSDSEGCILVGEFLTPIAGQLAVSNSRKTLKKFMEAAKKINRFHLIIN
jgi:hypothetical protein